MKNFFIALFLLFVFWNIWLFSSGNTFIYRVLYHNLADIDDYKIFPERTIHKSSRPQPWKLKKNNGFHLSSEIKRELQELETIAVLFIKSDSICYEEYWDGYGKSSYSNSFSMAKSYVSAMIGIALKKGMIKNIDQKVSDILPEFSKGLKKEITIRHLLTMSSGLNWKEEYLNPFSTVSEAYYGNDLHKIISMLDVVETPGKSFKYKGGDTQILSFIIEKVSGMSLSKFAEENLWKPMGAENDAIWSLDKENGEEKASCCLNSNARDFARIGKLYMKNGKWNGTSLINQDFIQLSLTPNMLKDSDGETVYYYGFQWWIIPDYNGHKIFYARGVSGQYVIVVPDSELIIVRLGKKRGEKVGHHLKEVYSMVNEGLKMK